MLACQNYNTVLFFGCVFLAGRRAEQRNGPYPCISNFLRLEAHCAILPT